MTEAPRVAVAAVMIPEEQLIRVLVVDDREPFRNDMREYFGEFGYAVDLAKDPNEGKVLLEKNKYQIVLYDVNFDGFEVKGDKYVLSNYKDFKGARVVVVTALEVNQLRSTGALHNIGVSVWGKADTDWGSNLEKLTEGTVEARKQEIANHLNQFMSDKLGISGKSVVTDSTTTAALERTDARMHPVSWEVAVEDMLVEWLQSQDNPDHPFLSIGRTVLSPNKMLDHIEQKTTIGIELLDRFVTEVRYSLHLKT